MRYCSIGMERCFLLALDAGSGANEFTCEESLRELGELANTAGLTVVGFDLQKLERPAPGSYFGKGKIELWRQRMAAQRVDVAVIDAELKPNQQRFLEESWDLKVVDRTMLILDIFAQRAKTLEAQLQIELAQLNYLYPRLTRLWAHLGQQKGGIGLRGPGETQLEVDKRGNRKRAAQIEKRLATVVRTRTVQRKRRATVPVPVVSLVGYTNAGKSTLFNALTQANVLAENKLFATLDPTTRHIVLPGRQKILLSDTVGFIQKLPHGLVKAFYATLEEVAQADLLLHVVDASHPKAPAMVMAVMDVLKVIGADQHPIIVAANKLDLGSTLPWKAFLNKLTVPVCAISATRQQGLKALLDRVRGQLSRFRSEHTFFVPHADSKALATLQARGELSVDRVSEQGTWVKGWVDKRIGKEFEKYMVVAQTTST